MNSYNKYLILSTDEFDPTNFSLINDEIIIINERARSFPSFFKVEMILSFLKDHSLQTNWIKENPQLTELITSGSLFTGSIESLFESCRNNPVFKQDLESYLKQKFSKMHLLRIQE